MKWVRISVVALLAAAVAAIVIRIAFVAAYADSDPRRAAAAWPGHPTATLRAGLVQIGETAAAGRPVGGDIINPLLAAARSAPLSPEPFLVRGVQLRVEGDETAAGKAFAEAKRRDPRSIPARFFLSDHYLRTGKVEPGLVEVADLTRLVPGSAARLAPVLAGYAKMPGAVPQLKAMLRAHPDLEDGMLSLLAEDPANADLVLSLASARPAGPGQRPAWQTRLVERLAAAGEYQRAYSLWARLMGRTASERPHLFDPRFEQPAAMPPFGWSLVSGSAGLVEPDGGGLHVIYYGRDDVILASQTLLLGPGPHQLAMKIANGGPAAASLSWTISCLPKNNSILSVDLARASAATTAHRFTVPVTGCAGQRIELVGKAPEYPQTVDLTMTQLRLSRAGS